MLYGASDPFAEAGIVAGAFLALGALITLLWRVNTKAVRFTAWLKTQLEPNGEAHRTGQMGSTFRDLQDRQTALLEATNERTEHLEVAVEALLRMVATLGDAHQRMEVNQRELGRRIGDDRRRLDDHLYVAELSIQRLEEHLADHEHEED